MKAEAARLTKQHAAEAACTNGVFSLKPSKNLKLLSSAANHAASAFVVHARARTMTPVTARWLQAARTKCALTPPSSLPKQNALFRGPQPHRQKAGLHYLDLARAGHRWVGLTRFVDRKKQSSWHFPPAGPQHTVNTGKTRPLAAAIPHREPHAQPQINPMAAYPPSERRTRRKQCQRLIR